ncbi:hypothetical protein GQ54DRAFT_196098 [Martensiomyces pterosporus]|nr:hypothetical protein GQ54DRAFT_196098 [Martensiomyces pterosporus]
MPGRSYAQVVSSTSPKAARLGPRNLPGPDGNLVLPTDPVEVEQAVSAFFEGHFTSMLEQDVQIHPEWEEAYRPRTDIDYSSVLAPLSPTEFEGFIMHRPCKKGPGPSIEDFEMLWRIHPDARNRLLAQANEDSSIFMALS